MRILQIEDFFHPDAGYQVNVLSKYLTKAGHEVIILTSEMLKVPESLTSFFGRSDLEEKDREFERCNKVKIVRVPLRCFAGNRFIYTRMIYKKIRQLAPDLLYVHGNDTYIGMTILRKPFKYDCAIVSDSHMLKMASANKLHVPFCWWYKTFVTPSIQKNNIPIIRTQDDCYVQSELGIPLEQSPYIPLGSDTMLFRPSPEKRQEFRRENGISEDAFVVIYAGKLDEAKGGDLLADGVAEKINSRRQIVFLIVGNTNGEYGMKIEAKLKASKNSVLRFPTQKYTNLASFFQASDLALFPKQCSLSFYDAQACGLPVVFEDNNINPDRSKAGTAFTFRKDNVSDFRAKIEYCAALNPAEYALIAQRAQAFIDKEYSYEDTAKKYLHVMTEAKKHFDEVKRKDRER